MSNLNLAFYTYFFGKNDNPSFAIPDIPSLKYKCYYYTNNKTIFEKLKETEWIGIFIDIEFKDDVYIPNMYGKHLKSMPQEYQELKDYDYLCFFDSKINNLNVNFIEDNIHKYFINDNKALILRLHDYITTNNVWSEFRLSMYQPRYYNDRYRYLNYINNQLNNGFKATDDYHCVCGYLIRNMKHTKIIELNSTWYNHIKECGIQDQISFFFAKQLFKDYIVPIPFDAKLIFKEV
jgi:hypothetical protein